MGKMRTEFFLYLSILAVFAIGQSIGAIDGAIAKVAQAFSIPQSTAMYCSTVGSIVSVVASLVIGTFAGRKVGYRPIAIFSGFMLVVGGVLPFFATDFTVLCLLRAAFGIGLGGILAIQNPIAVALVKDPHVRARILGIGTFIAFAFNCVEDVVGGVLADIAWNYAFLTYAILAIPYLFYTFTLPSIPKLEETDRAERKPFPKVIIAMFAMTFICGISITPLLVGCSFLSSAIVDSGTVAGIAAVCFSVGCMFGGLLFAPVYDRIGRKCMTPFCFIAAIGLFGCAITRNIVVLCLFLAVSGMGFASIQASVMMLVGLVCDHRSVSIASGLVMGALNLGAFLCTNWMDIIGKLTGSPLYNTIYIGAAAYCFFAVVLLIKSPFPQQESLNLPESPSA